MMNELSEKEKRLRVYLVTLAFALFSILLFGFIYLATTPAKTLTILLSFSGSISNIYPGSRKEALAVLIIFLVRICRSELPG